LEARIHNFNRNTFRDINGAAIFCHRIGITQDSATNLMFRSKIPFGDHFESQNVLHRTEKHKIGNLRARSEKSHVPEQDSLWQPPRIAECAASHRKAQNRKSAGVLHL
jgi:hypothetical protein